MVDSICISGMNSRQLQELLARLGEPKFRAKQLQCWLYGEFAISYDEMTDLPRTLRDRLAQQVPLHCLTPVKEVGGGGDTIKTLFALTDGKTIESALMCYPAAQGRRRYTVCVSTQVGCAVGCPFCATGQQGFERNLTPGEIVDQVLYFSHQLKNHGKDSHVTNLVFMGMGEPLANYEALWSAIEILTSPDGFGLGARHITVSTSGLIPQIERLSQEPLQVGLAISLHAGENALRNNLVPINRKYPLEQLIPACQAYFTKTGRRPTFEYALFDGINDSLEQARTLARLLTGLNCHVNLIAANHTANDRFRPPKRKTVLAFEKELKLSNINCTLRQAMGLNIDAGCGQLRSRFQQDSGN